MASADGKAPPTERESTAPSLCVAGCGFFGNSSTGNMCSKCYKETVAKTASAPAPSVAAPVCKPAEAAPPAAVAPTPPPPAPAALAAASPVAQPPPAATPAAAKVSPPPVAAASASNAQVRPAEGGGNEEEPPKKIQANTSRCWTCNRKIGLTGFQCKCEYWFCAEHRYSDRHECIFDFKSQAKQLLTKANPTIAPAKLNQM